ncbi:hypothetical protein NBZ79_08025 [Sneathiella marina]|uniref:Uncharacterized protein n=1 Tax=Sneathiella marina TaxID=2950108 RepID=A0ABY4W6Y2_9PROT|nr:hypothetical protein [Sneathiella marina]USG62923.1 hypothetical protein NBZ79_08025 [Sneathiella marina]
MKIKLRESLLGLAMMVAIVTTAANVVRADFADGVTAYEAGNYKAAFDEWLPLAQKNDPAAMRNVGHIYRRGLGVDQDYKKALNWYKRAATLGFDRAQANVGDMYLKGEGVPQDYEQAVQWFARAAQQGHVLSQYNLGLLLENGLGVEKNDELALGWYEAAAQAGYAPAIEKATALKSGVVVAKKDASSEQPKPSLEVPTQQTAAVEPEESLKVAPIAVIAAATTVEATEVIRSSDVSSSQASKLAETAPESTQKQGFYDALKSLTKEKPAVVAATAATVPVVAASQDEDRVPVATIEETPEVKVAAVAAVPVAAAVSQQSAKSAKEKEVAEPTAKSAAEPAPAPVKMSTAAVASTSGAVSTTATVKNGLTLEEKLEMADLAYTLKEYQQSLSIWAVLAQQNNAEAQYRLGKLFYSGHAVPIDRVRAYYWWEKAKGNGSADAGVALANLEKTLTHMELRQIQRTN